MIQIWLWEEIYLQFFFKADACGVTGSKAKHIQKKPLANICFQKPIH